MNSIKLQPKDGEMRCLDIDLAKMSVTLKNMIENVSDLEKVVPLPQISATVLDKVLEWIQYHSDDPMDCEEDSDSDESCDKCAQDINAWDKEFFNLDREVMFDVILAANFLDIKGLLRIGCKVAAEQLKGKSAEEVRKLWNIECDLDPEEEKRIRTENAWTEK